ncbi:uncharacterized protein STEHIDRAFT_157047 [Stereum hirsutum FP-91666 SS1]|uniref:uncharacterized protein n=1 Tax=Stereum hirsutum (strain FP-91666) TaxID=721885 RepID=UPI000440B86B|nr:uncharacterized protein STEHIDRAFT_157047 [Stereum hirsutum FP-91666 SS1]EIM86742.1 hypothetical protein STEHIDRAFT_157047 [Stereum hirsutum FP-91666 SS1]
MDIIATPPGCIASSFTKIDKLLFRLCQNPNFEDIAANGTMLVQELQGAYENQTRQKTSLPIPLWFWVQTPQGFQQGIDVEDDPFDIQVPYLYQGDLRPEIPFETKANFRLHIAPKHCAVHSPQIGIKSHGNLITTAAIAKKIAREVINYFSEPSRSVPDGMGGEIIPRRLRLVGLTWVSDGAMMAMLQIVM